MRFYRIIPSTTADVAPNQGTDVHWLLAGHDRRWSHETFYPAACGANYYGSVAIAYKAELVTCEECQLMLIAQFLRDEDMKEAFEKTWARRVK